MGAFKLGKMTFGSLFKKPETTLYPVQKKAQPEGLKGSIIIDVDSCILCSLCEKSCPTSCIKVDKPNASWSIDHFACVQCGYCVTVCPKKCLLMDPNYAAPSADRHEEKYTVPQREKAEKKTEKKPAANAAPAATEAVKEADVAKEMQDVDELLEAKIALMDAEKAKKVREALNIG